MREEFNELVGLEISILDLSNKLQALGCSDMGDIGNLNECISDGSASVTGTRSEGDDCDYDLEINVEFEVIKMPEEFYTDIDTVVKVTSIYEI